ncbi:MAG TPA: AfsR/SARP family transcriptional regulator [Streptosporangiaceae bacterium]
MRVRCLGALIVESGRAEIVVRASRRARLLAGLLARPNEVIPAERLYEELWDDELPDKAENALQAHVTRLRRDLQMWCGGAQSIALSSRYPGYLLQLDVDQLDALEFMAGASRANNMLTSDSKRAAAEARQALQLCRGTAFTGMTVGPLAQITRCRMEELRVSVLETFVEANLREGRHRELIPELEELMITYPHHESFCRQLMIALYRSGRQVEAIQHFRRARDRLVAEMGIEPTPALNLTFTQILRHDPALVNPLRI